MNSYILLIVNCSSGNCRNIIMKAKDMYSARRICEDCCLRKNELLMCLFPEKGVVMP